MKKFTALLTAILLTVAVCLPVFAADDGKFSVTLRIEGIEGNISYKTYETDKTNMADFIAEADASDDSIKFTVEESQYGAYVSAINDEKEGTFGGYDGWCFLVNGEQSQTGMSSVTLKDNDSIVFYYSCDGMQFPQINTDKLSEGIISWTSDDVTYDASYNPTVTTNPVKGATVTWYSGDTCRQYVTDDNGAVRIDSGLLTGGAHKISIEKKGDNGEPLVLRYAPDYAVDIEKNEQATAENVPTGDRGILLLCAAAVISIIVFGVTFTSWKEINEN